MDPNPRLPGHRFLHSPGPTHVPDEVQDAMRRQPMDLADPRVDRNIAACERGLRRLVQTDAADVFMVAANGHGAWEVVVENLVPPGAAVLIPGTGHFSESWALQTEALGRRVVRTPWREGLPIDAGVVEAALRADVEHRIVAVFAVHTDTASGVTSDLAALRAAIDAADHPARFVVDVVASLAAAPFGMDALRVDVAVGASQKGLMLPPGLAFVAVGAAAQAVAARNPAPRFYWDWRLRRSELSYRKFCGTPPQTLLFGLEAALGLIFREGLEAVLARHRLLASAVHAAVDGWSEAGGLGFFAQAPASRSTSVTAVQVAAGIDAEALRSVARERFQVAMAGGLGPLAGRVFRIGHLGDMNPAMVLGCLGGIQAAMTVQGIPFGRDGVARAIARLAEGEPGRFATPSGAQSGFTSPPASRMSSDPLLTPSLAPLAEAPLADEPGAPGAVADDAVMGSAVADDRVPHGAVADDALADDVPADGMPTDGPRADASIDDVATAAIDDVSPAETPADAGPPADASPAACGPQLKALFPGLFGGPPRPLKLRIQVDIQARAPGVFTRKMLSAFLHRYTGSHAYLMAVARGSQRFDLDGQACAELSAEHREVAAAELARRRGNQDERRGLEEQQRRNRAGLLRDFETTTLTPANFCALKGVAEAELEGLLARARAEAAERPLPPPHHPHARAHANPNPRAPAPATQGRPLPGPQRQRPGPKREAR